MVMGFGSGRLPEVPDPTKIAQSGAEMVKAAAQGGIGVGVDIAEGIHEALFQTVEGTAHLLSSNVTEIVSILKRDINTGKTTIDKVRGDIDRACSSVLSQVDQTIGGEIVRKFKSEVERQLR